LSQRLSLPPETTFDRVKAFFKFSETILIARVEAIVGFLAIVFASLDWSPLFGITNFDTKQVGYLGGLSLVKGVATEWARRRNSTI
jgi:hypothetical protein